MQNMVTKTGFHSGNNFRFAGGLHAEWKPTSLGTKFMGHYDFFDAGGSLGGFLGHTMIEIGWKGVVSGMESIGYDYGY